MVPSLDLSKEDTAYLKKAKDILDGLLDELKAKGWIIKHSDFVRDKPSFAQTAIITRRVNGHAMTTNMLTEAFTSKTHATTRCLIDLHVGFTKDNVLDFWAYEIFFSFLESTELFTKLLLLALLPKSPFRKGITFGQFVRALKKACPTYGHELAEEMDVSLRNSVAHGNYWMVRNRDGSVDLCYFKKLGDLPTVEPLKEIVVRMRRHNLLGLCLNRILRSRFEMGFFS